MVINLENLDFPQSWDKKNMPFKSQWTVLEYKTPNLKTALFCTFCERPGNQNKHFSILFMVKSRFHPKNVYNIDHWIQDGKYWPISNQNSLLSWVSSLSLSITSWPEISRIVSLVVYKHRKLIKDILSIHLSLLLQPQELIIIVKLTAGMVQRSPGWPPHRSSLPFLMNSGPNRSSVRVGFR